MQEYIYMLCEVQGKPYYVGRTNDMTRRMTEHNRDYLTGTEAKYQYMRDLDIKGIKWEMVLITQVGENTDHYEDFWVYTLIMEGYDLTNMKAGDSKKAAQRDAMLEMRDRGTRFPDAAAFLTAREVEIKQAESRKKAEKLIAKTRGSNTDTDSHLTLFWGDKPRESLGLGELRSKKRRR